MKCKKLLLILIAALCFSTMPFGVAAAEDYPQGLYVQGYSIDYNSQTGSEYLNVDDDLYGAVGNLVGYSRNFRLIYVDAGGKQTPLRIDQVQIPDGISVETMKEAYSYDSEVLNSLDDTYLIFHWMKKGNFQIKYDFAGVTYTLSAAIDLPEVAFYSGPSAKDTDMLKEWNYTGPDQPVYIAARDGVEILNVEQNSNHGNSAPLTVSIAADKKSAELRMESIEKIYGSLDFNVRIIDRNADDPEEYDENLWININDRTAGVFVPDIPEPNVSDEYDLISLIRYSIENGEETKNSGTTYTNEYDDAGNLIKKTVHWQSYMIEDSELWVYTYNTDGETIKIERGYYDKSGKFVAVYTAEGEQLAETQPRVTKDDRGNVITEEYNDSGFKTVYTYDKNDNMLTETHYDKDGKVTYQVVLTYNSDNTVNTREEIGISPGNSTEKFTFRYKDGLMSGFDYTAGGYQYTGEYNYVTNGDTLDVTASVSLVSGDGQTAINKKEFVYQKTGKSEPVFRFDDVMDESKFYFTPVYWAVDHDPQITKGVDAAHFAPDKTCTRGQVVTFLWRAKGCPAPTSTKNPFTDVKEDAFYYNAVLWAVENGITTGTSGTTFSPDAGCTRGQVATFLYRTEGSPKSGGSNPFADVNNSAFYYDAVLWAASSGVTAGTSKTEFSPNATCTRGQIVTFLYRDLSK